MIRVAACGDVHFGLESAGTLRPQLEHLGERADMFLVAGDLTRHGDPAEAKVLAEELEGLPVPVAAVLGNHDYHCAREADVAAALERVGVRLLEGDTITFDVNGGRVGIAGTKGFGGGFAGACGSEFGEPEMKAFMAHTRHLAWRFERALSRLEADVKIALLHYSPIEATLVGERLEIYPFLGSYLLAEAIDRAGADLAVHGHAHRGAELGVTPAGVQVRNVAQPVIRHAYHVYCFRGDGLSACDDAA